MSLTLSITNIPNDTFSFAPWIMRKIPGPNLECISYKDIETINKEISKGKGSDICKISFNTYPLVANDYQILTSGSAVVKGTGPKVVSKNKHLNFSTSKIAIPGFNTTAWLLAKNLLPPFKEVIELPYGKILGSVLSGKVEAGLLIHESSFAIKERGLIEAISLHKLWSEKTNGLPLALGGIVAKRSLGKEVIDELSKTLKSSIQYAKENPKEVEEFVRELSPIKDSSIISKSIDFWVNDESVSLSPEGKKSIETLVQLDSKTSAPLF